MNTSQMSAENAKLQQQLNEENKKYYGGMLVYIRTSDIDERQGEELLLEMLQHLLQAQKEGRSARVVFGTDPLAYCKDLVSQLPSRGRAERFRMVVMIPWITLTWMFLAYAVTGFLTIMAGAGIGRMNEVSPTFLFIAAVDSILVVKVILALMNKTAFNGSERKFRLLFLLLYIVSIGAVTAAGMLLKPYLPVFTVSPWISLLIFAGGYAGQKVMFGGRGKRGGAGAAG
ncbi:MULTISPECIES: DUF1129 family protein [unclassified Paenibacillus]|uniref:DUF1129 family protein n=1 Tax=unclassified Paenibacillus TaxID=185978 RepID=UPI00020D72E2|nr:MULTISPECIES: DUF1129 family protein [unclassified Paenibacillus]EGL15565.1 hypothetical protein HMPREF9413_5174 [Paenibacillus sp. HGF7]EPD88251.1 hypothetical protein HMPREF1207_02425 [Paenibacillus sp. HGH0039]